MTYATLDQLKDRYSERMLVAITDRAEPPAGEIDAQVVNRALADTDAMIDGYLAVRYRLPLASVPALVVDLAQMIAIYKLHPYAPDPKIEEDYKGALRALSDISTGKIRLSVEGAELSGHTGSGARMTDRERPLTADNLKGFI
ncbi:MAG: gp436 family protein [Roseinatronobacter sp.]